MNDCLVSCITKIERTQTQIDGLNTDIQSFIHKTPYEVVSKFNADRDEDTWSFRVKGEIPPLVPVLIGEILHNLRSALDQMICAVALDHSGSTKGTYFPFGTSAEHFEAQMAEKGKQLPASALEMIRTLKPYPGGNDLLSAIHRLNKADKHISVVPVNLRTSTNTTTYLIVTRGLVLTIGSRCGQFMPVDGPRPSAEAIASLRTPTGIYTTGHPGLSFAFGTKGCTADESFNFLVTTPGAEFQTDMKPTIDIAFKNIKGLELDPVVAVLNQMRQCADGIVVTFRDRFFP